VGASSSVYSKFVAAVGSDRKLQVFTASETTQPLEHLTTVKLGFLPRIVRFHPRLRNIVMIAGHDGRVRFYDLKVERWVEDVKVVTGSCLVSASWHPILPSTFLACTDSGVVFYGEDKRQ
jgi:WD40 repeat protein